MTCLTRLDSYQGVEQQWQDLLPACTVDTLFITPRWQEIWWDQFGDGAEMLLLSFNGGHSVEGIAPLVRRNGTISLMGDQDVCDYNDFLVAQGAESRFYPCLLDHLGTEKWERLELISLPENSPTLAYLPDLARDRGYTVDIREEDVVPGVDLPNNWDAYLQILSKKDRHELRRKLRRLHSSGDNFRYYKLSDPVEVENNLEDFFALMRFSKEEKHHFLNESRERFFRKMAVSISDIGFFKLFFMELNGERVASAICFDYGKSRLLYNSGFNPAYSYYSVGLLLKALCIQNAIEEGKKYFDFLRGPEPYKYDLGGTNKSIYQMVVRRN